MIGAPHRGPLRAAVSVTGAPHHGPLEAAAS
jgi:hypothetical protein